MTGSLLVDLSPLPGFFAWPSAPAPRHIDRGLHCCIPGPGVFNQETSLIYMVPPATRVMSPLVHSGVSVRCAAARPPIRIVCLELLASGARCLLPAWFCLPSLLQLLLAVVHACSPLSSLALHMACSPIFKGRRVSFPLLFFPSAAPPLSTSLTSGFDVLLPRPHPPIPPPLGPLHGFGEAPACRDTAHCSDPAGGSATPSGLLLVSTVLKVNLRIAERQAPHVPFPVTRSWWVVTAPPPIATCSCKLHDRFYPTHDCS